MQCPYVEVGTPQRNTVSQKAPAQLVKEFGLAIDARSLAEDSVLDLTPGIGAPRPRWVPSIRKKSSPLLAVVAMSSVTVECVP